MSKRVIVQFLKPWRGYAKDEKAGFDADTAGVLEIQKVAKVISGSAKKPKPAKPEPEKPAAAGGQAAGELPGGADSDDDKKP